MLSLPSMPNLFNWKFLRALRYRGGGRTSAQSHACSTSENVSFNSKPSSTHTCRFMRSTRRDERLYGSHLGPWLGTTLDATQIGHGRPLGVARVASPGSVYCMPALPRALLPQQ